MNLIRNLCLTLFPFIFGIISASCVVSKTEDGVNVAPIMLRVQIPYEISRTFMQEFVPLPADRVVHNAKEALARALGYMNIPNEILSAANPFIEDLANKLQGPDIKLDEIRAVLDRFIDRAIAVDQILINEGNQRAGIRQLSVKLFDKHYRADNLEAALTGLKQRIKTTGLVIGHGWDETRELLITLVACINETESSPVTDKDIDYLSSLEHNTARLNYLIDIFKILCPNFDNPFADTVHEDRAQNFPTWFDDIPGKEFAIIFRADHDNKLTIFVPHPNLTHVHCKTTKSINLPDFGFVSNEELLKIDFDEVTLPIIPSIPYLYFYQRYVVLERYVVLDGLAQYLDHFKPEVLKTLIDPKTLAIVTRDKQIKQTVS